MVLVPPVTATGPRIMYGGVMVKIIILKKEAISVEVFD